jgi:hypothetical protein
MATIANPQAWCSLRAVTAALSLVGGLVTMGGCPGGGDGSATTEGGSTLGGSTLGGSTLGEATRGTSDSTTAASGVDSTGSTSSTTSGDTTPPETSTDTDERPAPGGTIIPLYTYPTDSTWAVVEAAKADHPEVEVVAIINPDSGPGAMLDPTYDAGITMLQDAGVVVIGYVYTSYAARSLDVVQTDISTYAAFYPQLEGIMFDEMSNVVGDEDYYAQLTSFSEGFGMGLTVGNPGTGVPQSFVGTVDTLFVYEDEGLPDPMSLGGWPDAYERSNFAIIPHSVASLDAGFVSAALVHVGYVYVTDDVLPNPWDTLPIYFDELVLQLAAG